MGWSNPVSLGTNLGILSTAPGRPIWHGASSASFFCRISWMPARAFTTWNGLWAVWPTPGWMFKTTLKKSWNTLDGCKQYTKIYKDDQRCQNETNPTGGRVPGGEPIEPHCSNCSTSTSLAVNRFTTASRWPVDVRMKPLCFHCASDILSSCESTPLLQRFYVCRLDFAMRYAGLWQKVSWFQGSMWPQPTTIPSCAKGPKGSSSTTAMESWPKSGRWKWWNYPALVNWRYVDIMI